MITITDKQFRALRTVFRRTLNVSPRGHGPPLEFRSGPDGLCIRARNEQTVIEYRSEGPIASNHVSLPFSVLTECEPGKDEPLTFEMNPDGRVTVRWMDGRIPRKRDYDAESIEQPAEFPSEPRDLSANEPRLLAALRDAVETTDRDSLRHAMNCIQLDGQRSRIVATDGRQLLVQTGLQFPWDDCVLVPGNQFFKCRDLPRNCSIQVGRTDEFVMIRVGPWTIHLAIDAESRFPEVDALIPDGNQAAATMSLSDSDADFLLKNIKRLPGRNDSNEAVTIDLNGSVIVRAKGDDQEHPTDLLLASSRRSGEPIRCSSDRGYLSRAMSLGFREVSFIGSEAPLLCQDQHRRFVWAVLTTDSIISADPRAILIESPVTDPAKHPLNHKRTENHKPTERTRRSMPTSNPSGNGQPTEEDSSSLSLIEQSESLKQSLQQALTQTRELIAALKRQKKQAQLVQSTLNSLRQLQSVDV